MTNDIKIPDIAAELIQDYSNADFDKRYVGYFEIPQEDAKELALFIEELLARVRGLK